MRWSALIVAVLLILSGGCNTQSKEAEQQKVRVLLMEMQQGDGAWWHEVAWDGPITAKVEGKPRVLMRLKFDDGWHGGSRVMIFDVTDAAAKETAFKGDDWDTLRGKR